MKASDLSYIISSINSVCRELKREQETYDKDDCRYGILRDLQMEFDSLGCKTVSTLSHLSIDFDINEPTKQS